MRNLVSPDRLLFIMSLIALIGPLSMGIYLPAFPKISMEWHLRGEELSITMSAFMVGTAIGQLIYGICIDKFGSFRPLIIGVSIYIVSILLCYFSTSIVALAWGRFIMAFGACAGGICSRVGARLFFPKEKLSSTFSTITLIISLSPIASPIVGNFLIDFFHWRAVFIFLGFFALLAAIGVLLLYPRIEPANGKNVNFSTIKTDYLHLFESKQFTFYTLILSFSMASSMIFVSSSAFIFIDGLHFSRNQYILVFSIVGIGAVLGNFINRKALRKMSSNQIICYALIFQFIISGIFVLMGKTLPTIWVIVYFFLFLTMQGTIAPNSTALAIGEFTENIGVASSVNLSISMMINALGTFFVSKLGIRNYVGIVEVMLSFVGLAIVLNIIYTKKTTHNISYPSKDVYLTVGETK